MFMKKLLFLAAMCCALFSCEENVFDYNYQITVTTKPYCGSSFDFAPFSVYKNVTADVDEATSEQMKADYTFEKIIKVTIDGKETKAIQESSCTVAYVKHR